jgi:hypothetical protein
MSVLIWWSSYKNGQFKQLVFKELPVEKFDRANPAKEHKNPHCPVFHNQKIQLQSNLER